MTFIKNHKGSIKMNDETKDWGIPTMEKVEEMYGVKKQKKEETEKQQTKEESRTEKLVRLKEQAKQKRQELDSIYKEIEDSL